jgi:hypothetical protein
LQFLRCVPLEACRPLAGFFLPVEAAGRAAAGYIAVGSTSAKAPGMGWHAFLRADEGEPLT